MRKRSLTPPKGFQKAFSASRLADTIPQMPVQLGLGAMGAPQPGEAPQGRLESRKGTTTRLRDTVKMMQKGRV